MMKSFLNKRTLLAAGSLLFNSCSFDELSPDNNNMNMPTLLSSHHIFQGNPADLTPASGFELYELSTDLFTDYAEKQRLIKVPDGYTLKATGDGLPDFPDGTILVKTFYYLHDYREANRGKYIIETRLEIKRNSQWNVAIYLWNDEQTDARLLTSGFDKVVNWIDQRGAGRVVNYHIPSNRECATCHNVSGSVMPIGPKLRNLNRDVTRAGISTNQLSYFLDLGLLEPVDPSSLGAMPNWSDGTLPLSDRARAYLDVNCAHCHNPLGYVEGTRLYLDYDRPYRGTGISTRKAKIVILMEHGEMPRLGITVVHQEGLQLIESYINSLN
jgi:uncharacterized repeat protein (TIGR03806 family)